MLLVYGIFSCVWEIYACNVLLKVAGEIYTCNVLLKVADISDYRLHANNIQGSTNK